MNLLRQLLLIMHIVFGLISIIGGITSPYGLPIAIPGLLLSVVHILVLSKR